MTNGLISGSTRFRRTEEEIERKLDDLQHAYEQVDDPEAMEKDQKTMISNVFDFRESTVSNTMTPRTEISAITRVRFIKNDPFLHFLRNHFTIR